MLLFYAHGFASNIALVFSDLTWTQDQKLFHRQIRPSSHKRKNCSVESHITVIRHGSADFDGVSWKPLSYLAFPHLTVN